MITNKKGVIPFFLLLVIAASASAQSVFVQGSAEGRFNAQSFTSSAAGNDIRSILGLGYKRSTFSGTTVGGFLAFGGNDQNAFVSGPPNNVDNWGSITLLAQPNTYTGNTFTLELTFSQPGVSSGTFSANILGAVSAVPDGGVFIDFDNSNRSFVYNNGVTTGTVTFNVNDVSVNSGLSAAISGNVFATSAPVPEPASLAALGTGAIALLRRRRRKASR